MALSTGRHSFMVADYHRMARASIWPRTHAWNCSMERSPIWPRLAGRHQARLDRLADFFFGSLRDQVIVRIQGSIRLDERSEPNRI